VNAPFLLAQISDAHIVPQGQLAYGRAETAEPLARLVAFLNALKPRPAAVLASGDMTDGGRPEACARLAGILAGLAMPLYLVPGNHDPKGSLRTAFPDLAYLDHTVAETDGQAYHCYAVEEHPIRLVGLDTVTPGRHGGGLGPVRLAWLADTLAQRPDAPTLVFMHHPPFASGMGSMDQSPFRMRAELAAILAGNPQVQRLACGHLHRTVFRRFGGALATACPSPSLQLILELTPTAKNSFNLEPAGLLLHQAWDPWGDGLEIITHAAVIPEAGKPFPGPFPFGELVLPRQTAGHGPGA
jgi:3',5'-cyclic-AMP phosphodiesterase